MLYNHSTVRAWAIRVWLLLPALVLTGCGGVSTAATSAPHAVSVDSPRAPSVASLRAVGIAQDARLPTAAFHLQPEAARLVDWLISGPFMREWSLPGPKPRLVLASVLTPKLALALLQHESANIRAYVALYLVELARYDAVEYVLGDDGRVKDATTCTTSEFTVAGETADALCRAESDLRARDLIERALQDERFRPSWSRAVPCAGRLRLRSARERALALLDDRDEEIQRSAFYALEYVADDADAPRLLGVLGEGVADRRWQAAAVLEHVTGAGVVDALEHAAQSDADEVVRAVAARAYAHHNEARKNVLQTLLADPSEQVVEHTIDGLARRGGPGDLALMVDALSRADWLAPTLDLGDAFAKPPQKEWIVPMRKLVEARGSGVREAALKWLGRAHDRAALPLVRKALRSKDFFDRFGAISAVANLSDRDSVSLLVALLADENPHLRVAAARALTVLHAQNAYGPLSAAAARENEKPYQQDMLEACAALREGREIAVDTAE